MRLKISKAEKVAYLRFHAFYAFCAFAWLRFCTFVLFVRVKCFCKKIKIKTISNRPNDLIYITADIDSMSRQIQDPCKM